MCACSCTYGFHLLCMCYTALHKHVLSFRESGCIYGNIFKFFNNSRAWFAFCNIYVIYMLKKMHVISQVDVIMLPIPLTGKCGYLAMGYANALYHSGELSWVHRYDVVCSGFAGRGGSGGYKRFCWAPLLRGMRQWTHLVD